MLQLLVNRRLIPFLGNGVNLMDRSPDAQWRPGSAQLPSGVEIAQYLAAKFSYPQHNQGGLMEVAQYAELVAGRARLFRELREVLEPVYQPTRLHQVLARLSRLLRERGRASGLPIIVTTTFDDLLEQAFLRESEPFDVVSYISDGADAGSFLHHPPTGPSMPISQPSRYQELLDDRTVILKLHGGLDRQDHDNDSYVITEDDFIDYITRAADANRFLPAALQSSLMSSSYLFLGYTLRDWNLRVLVRQLWDNQP